MTTTTLTEILEAFESTRSAARPEGLTASGLHPICKRQTAWRLQGTAPTDDEPLTGAATVGTMLHAWYETYWRQTDPGAIVEQRGAHGTPDVYRPDVPELRDLKTLNRRKFDAWLATGVPSDVWDQLAVYGFDVGLPDEADLVVDALCRETGRSHTYVASYAREWGLDVVTDLEGLSVSLTASDPLGVPTGARSGRGDWFCDRCPFRSMCLTGDEPTRGEYDDEQIVAAAELYERGAALSREADALKKEGRGVLKGVTGEFGEYEVRWTETERQSYTVAGGVSSRITVRRRA